MTSADDPAILDLIKSAFDGLDDEAAARLAGAATLVEVAPGARLASEGDPADGVYVVAEGSIQLAIHQRQADLTVATLSTGELLGWSWAVEPHRWTFDVSSAGGASLVRVPMASLEGLVDEHPRAGVALYRAVVGVLSRRLRDTRVQLLDLHGSARVGR
jgi:CRP-like cAMP-binding protein